MTGADLERLYHELCEQGCSLGLLIAALNAQTAKLHDDLNCVHDELVAARMQLQDIANMLLQKGNGTE